MAYDSHDIVETGAATIAYHETGFGEPLILHHGAESHKGQYGIFVPHLVDHIRAISYDQRDVGDAVASDGPYSMGDLADDCIDLMDALGIEKAHIMGISFGGAIAMHVGVRHPDRVQSLVVGAAPDNFQHPNQFLERVRDAAVPEERAALMLDASLSPAAQQDEQMMATLRGLFRGRVTAPGSYRSDTIASHELTAEDLSRITAPTLLVYGELDPLVPPELGRILEERIPQAEMVVLPGARHGLSFEFREQLAGLVNEFIVRHSIAS